MVLAFFCHSVSGTPCRVLYSCVYGDDLHLPSSEGASMDSLRELRKEQLLQIACRVQAEYHFREACKERIPRRDDYYLSSGSVVEDSGDKGLFRLYPGDPFSTAKVVIWQISDGCAYVLVCELDENRLQAESVLSQIIRVVQESVTSHEQKNAEIMLKAEKLTAILQEFLPCGQILFMNHKVIAQCERQFERLLSGK